MTDPPNRRERAKPNDPSWMRIGVGEIVIDVSAQPRSSRRGVVRAGPQGLVIAVNSAPEKGKANDELIDYLADELRIPRAAIMMIRGATSRKKIIRIITHEPTRIAARLTRISNPE
ncbi:MAG: DUF167 domain-containing protein [Candidatus Binatus sp.]|uniref:DUF167 domain-containing protein n=1 Tax=Candidatus Binatus sp. TaxID=2811406 RepID=UPI0027202172|nr:DUF167 domain-containing protein [Candidatus Binatus sp.]MDO8434141.1 DUF167 domain-containing protein [Candidatus Binatus sp.]